MKFDLEMGSFVCLTNVNLRLFRNGKFPIEELLNKSVYFCKIIFCFNSFATIISVSRAYVMKREKYIHPTSKNRIPAMINVPKSIN